MDKLIDEALRLVEEGTKESLEKAISKYLEAVPLYRASGEKELEANALNSVGTIYSNLGDQVQALNYFALSLSIYWEIGDPHGQAVILNNMGRVFADVGETQKAIDCYARALPRLKAAGDREGEATTLNNLGGLYYLWGKTEKALDYFERSLMLRRSGDHAAKSTALTNIGTIYSSLGEIEKAMKYYKRALRLYRAAGDRRCEAHTLNLIGQVYADSRDLKKAFNYYARALPLSRSVGDRGIEAEILCNYAAGFVIMGEHRQALDFYLHVLPLYQAIGDRGGEAGALFNIAYNERGLGDLAAALVHIEEALTIVESLRADIGSQALRSSYFATVQDYYEFQIDLLIQLHGQEPSEGFDGRALEVAERARVRSLLETLAEAGADIRQGADPALLERERALRQRLNDKGQERIKLLNGPHSEEEAATLDKELDVLTTAFGLLEAQIRQVNSRYAALIQPQPLTAQEIQQQLLDRRTLLLEYALGRDRSYLWAVTRNSIKCYELPKRAEIEDAVRQVYESLRNEYDWAYSAAAATRLAQTLLAPVADQLGRKRLLIAADGALQFIPFSALPIPSAQGDSSATAYRPLITEHEIISLPSASALAALRRDMNESKSAAKTIAIFADPVFTLNDVRFAALKNVAPKNKAMRGTGSASVSREQHDPSSAVARAAIDSGLVGAGNDIPPLPGTRIEAERIMSLVAEEERMCVFDFEVNRAAVADPGLAEYRYVHFATHGFLDSKHPELSGILLSMYDRQGVAQDGFLRAHEIFNLKLSAELVTLSACQTGLGKEIRGEGLMSLTRGFMYAGAPRVVVSLWNVSDEATAELMARFYREILKKGKRPAAALRAAQISMLKEQDFASPYYWAAFTLQGEWR